MLRKTPPSEKQYRYIHDLENEKIKRSLKNKKLNMFNLFFNDHSKLSVDPAHISFC